MTVIFMEPLVIRARAPGTPVIGREPPVVPGRAPLTNRAAGLLRAAGALLGQTSLAVAAGTEPLSPTVAVPTAEGGPAATATAEGGPVVAATAEGGLVVAATAEGGPVVAATAEGGSVTTATPEAGPAAMPTAAGTTVGPAPTGITTPAALVAAVTAAARDLPRADVGRPMPTPVLTRLGEAAQARAGRPLSTGGGRPSFPVRPVEPIEIDPVPGPTAALSIAVNERLRPLTLPPVKPLPDRTVPVVPPIAVRSGELELALSTSAIADASAAVNRTEAARATAATRPVADPATPLTPVPIEPPVLLDVRAEPPQPVGPSGSGGPDAELETAQITRVLAIIMASVQDRAKDFGDAVRVRAFPRWASGYLDVLTPHVAAAQLGLSTKMYELGEAAAISRTVLDAAAETRRAELATHVAHRATEAELEVRQTAVTLTRAAAQEQARIRERELRDQARQVARLRAALHSRDPALVEGLVTTRVGFVDADVARGVVAIDAAKARRLELLTSYDTAYRAAYASADSTFQHRTTSAPARAPPSEGGRLWIDVARDELTTAMSARRTQTEQDAATLDGNVRAAGQATKDALHAWSDGRLRRTATAEATAATQARDRAATALAIGQARTAAQQAAVRDQLTREIRFAASAYLQAADARAQVSRQHALTLNAAQLAQGQRYLAHGDPGDPLSAVAASLTAQWVEDHAPPAVASVTTEITSKVPATEAEARDLAQIYFPGGSGELHKRADRLHAAFEVWHGTAEESAIEALGGDLDGPSTALLNRQYALKFHEDLPTRIRSEMSGADRDMALGLATHDRQLHAKGVIADSDGFWSNDPNRALEAIRNLPPGQAAAVVADPETREHLTTVLGGTRAAGVMPGSGSIADDRGERQLQLLVEINSGPRPDETAAVLAAGGPGSPGSPEVGRLRDLRARADAIELDRVIRGGSGGEAPSLDAVFERIRRSVTGDQRTAGWSIDQIDDEVRRRARAMELAYEQEFGSELPRGGVSALRSAISFYGFAENRQLALDLIDVNRAGERATRLEMVRTSGLTTSDSELNTELGRTYRDALAEVERSSVRNAEVEARAQQLMAEDGVTQPTGNQLRAYRREAREELARIIAQQWMGEVTAVFGDRYAWRWSGRPATALREMIESETQFGGEDEALHRLEGGGGLTAAQTVEHGVAGWGIEREAVVGALGGRTREQLARIGAEYATNNHGENMVDRLRAETGGWDADTPDDKLERDAFDIREALRGVPMNAREEYEVGRRRYDYERTVYFGGDQATAEQVVGSELASMRSEYEGLNARMREYEAAEAAGDTRATARLEVGLQLANEAVAVTADHYRTVVDEYVDRAAQVVAVTAAVAAAVVVGALVTVVTGGAAAPLVLALAGSIAGTAASMMTKQALLGSAYSRTALQTDLAVGVVDIVVTVLTARLGNLLLKLPKPTGATAAAMRASVKAIEAQRLTRPLLQRTAAFAAEQLAQVVPPAVTGALLSRDTWRGDPLRNVATAAGMAAMVGIGTGAAMKWAPGAVARAFGGAVEGWRMLRGGSGAALSADSVVLRSGARAAAAGAEGAGALNRGAALERMLARREFLRQFPGATELDFRRALAAGEVELQSTATSVRALQAEMRGHLLSGLTGADRELAAQSPIVVLSDAEFTAATGSQARGHAATLNIRGDPVVVIREGAPLSRLREEGLHVRQFFDPEHVGRLGLLREGRVLSSAGDRVAAWNAQLDLELEVQSQLRTQLRAELEAPDLPGSRAGDLQTQLGDVEAAADVLARRRGLLAGLRPDDVARMQRGDLPPPLTFLAEQPRLFARRRDPSILDEAVPRAHIAGRGAVTATASRGGVVELSWHPEQRHVAVTRRWTREATPLWGTAESRRPLAGQSPASAAADAPGVAAALTTSFNFFSDKPQRAAWQALVRRGIIARTALDDLQVVDVPGYLDWLDGAYRTQTGSPMHPRLRAAVEAHIRSGPLQTIGASPYDLDGMPSYAGYLPGTHAEVIVANGPLIAGADASAVVTLLSHNGGPFLSCLHCTGILRHLAPDIRLYTGTSVPYRFSETRQYRNLLIPRPRTAGSSRTPPPTRTSYRQARALVEARSMPRGLIRGDVQRVERTDVFHDNRGPLTVFLPPQGTRPLDLDRTAREVLRMAGQTAATPPTNQPSSLRVILDDLNLPPSEARALRGRIRLFADSPDGRDALSRIMSLDTATPLDR